MNGWYFGIGLKKAISVDLWIKHSSDFFKRTLKPIIEPSLFENAEALRFSDQ